MFTIISISRLIFNNAKSHDWSCPSWTSIKFLIHITVERNNLKKIMSKDITLTR